LKEEIWNNFYVSGAVLNREWVRAGYELWHTGMRMAVHGIHHKVCQVKVFHILNDKCVCALAKMSVIDTTSPSVTSVPNH
jgi:hypothetical protein